MRLLAVHLTDPAPPTLLPPAVLTRLLRAAPGLPGPGQRAAAGLLERLLTTERGATALPGSATAPALLRLLECEGDAGTHERAARALAAVCAADEGALAATVGDQPGARALPVCSDSKLMVYNAQSKRVSCCLRLW